MSKIIGRFVPTQSNDCGEQPFKVITKMDVDVDRAGFIGLKASGEEYHVFSEYWTFEPTTEEDI